MTCLIEDQRASGIGGNVETLAKGSFLAGIGGFVTGIDRGLPLRVADQRRCSVETREPESGLKWSSMSAHKLPPLDSWSRAKRFQRTIRAKTTVYLSLCEK